MELLSLWWSATPGTPGRQEPAARALCRLVRPACLSRHTLCTDTLARMPWVAAAGLEDAARCITRQVLAGGGRQQQGEPGPAWFEAPWCAERHNWHRDQGAALIIKGQHGRGGPYEPGDSTRVLESTSSEPIRVWASGLLWECEWVRRHDDAEEEVLEVRTQPLLQSGDDEPSPLVVVLEVSRLAGSSCACGACTQMTEGLRRKRHQGSVQGVVGVFVAQADVDAATGAATARVEADSVRRCCVGCGAARFQVSLRVCDDEEEEDP